MRTIFWVFLFLILFAGGGLYLNAHPGEIIIHWLGVEIELSITVFFVILLLVLLITLSLYKFFASIFSIPRFFKNRYAKFSHLRSLHAIEDSLTYLEIQDTYYLKLSANYIERSEGEASLKDYFEGKAAHLEENFSKAEEAFRKLLKVPALEVLGLINLAQNAQTQNQFANAAKILKRALELEPRSSLIHALVIDCDLKCENYQQALDQAHKFYRDFRTNEARALYLKALVARARQASATKDFKLAEKLYETANKMALLETPDLEAYAHILKEIGKERRAIYLLEQSYAKTQRRTLIQDYLKIKDLQTPTEQLQGVMRLLSFSTISEETRLVTARYALNAKLWSKAQEELNALLDKDTQNPEVFELLAKLELERGNTAGAKAWRERALSLMFSQNL